MPALTWVTVTPDSTPEVDTATGTGLLAVELLPSWPLVLPPQQYAAPALDSAQVELVPELTWVRVTPDSTPEVDTATGTLLLLTVLLPSWPLEFMPQQYAAPLLPSAHSLRLASEVIWVMLIPASTPDVDTATGVPLAVVVPLPSSPSALRPQQYTLPVLLSAQVK